MRWRTRLGAGAAVLVGGLVASVVYVPADCVAVLHWRGGGTAALLAPGVSLRVPFLQSVDRYPGGTVTLEMIVQVESREGRSIGLPCVLTARPSETTLLTLYRDGGAGGARAEIERLTGDRIRAAAARFGTYDLASGQVLGDIERRVGAALEETLGRGLGLSLGAPRVPPEVRASFEPEALFADRHATGVSLLLVGLDGADWDLINPLIASGDLPNLARIRSAGVWGRLRSSIPTLSPLLWTTVATGKAPDRHGINDFLVVDRTTGRRVPINSTFRRCKALWNILTDGGLAVDVVAWWATWPAEVIQGHLISDRVAYSTFDFAAAAARAGAVHPAAYADTVDRLRVTEDEVQYEQVARFLRLSEDEYTAARRTAAGAGQKTGSPTGAASETGESINVFVRVLAATETYRRVSLDLLQQRARSGQPARLFAVYLQGIDEVNHRFAHCAPPRLRLCSDADYRRFGGAVKAFYRYQDRVLGELIEAAHQPTVIVLSDHGFSSGPDRPDDVPPFIEGRPGLWHDLVGVFLASGPGVGRGEIPSVSLYDIAPTVLRLLGLPVPEDMPGEVIEAALAEEFRDQFPAAAVPSYEGLSGPENSQAGGPGEVLAGAADEEMIEHLRALGYVGASRGPIADTTTPRAAEAGSSGGGSAGGETSGGGVPTLLFHTNLGAVYTGKRQYDLAEAEFRKALGIDPSSAEALAGLAILYDLKGEPERSLELFRSLVHTDPHHAPARFYKMAELFVRLGRLDDGIAYLEDQRASSRPGGVKWETGVNLALGTLYAAAGRDGEAGSALFAALALDPASVPVMQELFSLYDAGGRAPALEPEILSALGRNPRSAMHYNWLGLVRKRAGDLRGAERAFRETLEIDPDLVGTMANLGGLYLQEGRGTEAVTVLEQALERNPRNPEARTNLIVALGIERDPDGAGRRLEEAEALGQRIPQFYNALAYALHVNGRDDEALEVLRRSLALDPRQADALRLRTEIEAGRPLGGRP